MTPRRSARNMGYFAVAVAVAVALCLAVAVTAGAGAADYAAGVVTGLVAAWAALRMPVERWARRAGVAVRAAVYRPIPRVPRPARTPIHDTAEQAQKGA